MNRVIIISLILSRAHSDMTSVFHRMYVSRKSRSNSVPIESGYAYSKMNSHPEILSTFGSHDSGHTYAVSEPVVEKYSDASLSEDSEQHVPKIHYFAPIPQTISKPVTTYAEAPRSKYAMDYAIAKAESKYDFMPSKIKTDAMYENLKSVMHYRPSPGDTDDFVPRYDSSSEYHIDDNDVRTSSRSSYDGWPYFYHSPYEYETNNIDSEIEKAKDKRYAVDTVKDVIPVHENHEDEVYDGYGTHVRTPRYSAYSSTDNPMAGHEPFFSFVLNDYFDRHDEDDPLVFKGLDWGKEFDHEPTFSDMDDYAKRNRRLGSYFTPNAATTNSQTIRNSKMETAAHGDSVTEKGYNKKYEFDNMENGDEEKENHRIGYDSTGQHYGAFKDFIDKFANKFGTEDHKKDAKYVLKKNQDKGENKKGFRRVYHKDEYQEDNEFYDNSNSSTKAEEKGSSNAHVGGSEGLLQSHATASLGNKTNAFNKSGNKENNKFHSNHRGQGLNEGFDNRFDRFKDVAKKVALSNEDDYTDHYRL